MRQDQEQPKRLTSHMVMVNGCKMHYRAGGRGKQSVVLVHGLTVSGNYLMPTAEKLAANFTVYLPELPGFGDSEKPRHVLDITGQAEVLREWMDVIGLERTYLMGNSMGCYTITVLAAGHLERVAGIILVSPVGDPRGRFTPWLVARALNDFVREPRSLWAIMVQDFLKVGTKRTILTLHNMQQYRLEEWLPRVNVPALVVGGGRDRIVPRWWIDRVAKLLPQGRMAIIGDAWHVPNYSHPVRLTALVRAFIESRNGTKS